MNEHKKLVQGNFPITLFVVEPPGRFPAVRTTPEEAYEAAARTLNAKGMGGGREAEYQKAMANAPVELERLRQRQDTSAWFYIPPTHSYTRYNGLHSCPIRPRQITWSISCLPTFKGQIGLRSERKLVFGLGAGSFHLIRAVADMSIHWDGVSVFERPGGAGLGGTALKSLRVELGDIVVRAPAGLDVDAWVKARFEEAVANLNALPPHKAAAIIDPKTRYVAFRQFSAADFLDAVDFAREKWLPHVGSTIREVIGRNFAPTPEDAPLRSLLPWNESQDQKRLAEGTVDEYEAAWASLNPAYSGAARTVQILAAQFERAWTGSPEADRFRSQVFDRVDGKSGQIVFFLVGKRRALRIASFPPKTRPRRRTIDLRVSGEYGQDPDIWIQSRASDETINKAVQTAVRLMAS